MNESQKRGVKEAPHKRVHNTWFPLSEFLKQAKLIYGKRYGSVVAFLETVKGHEEMCLEM